LQVRAAQELAGAPAGGSAAAAPLTLGEIRPIVAEAIARWAAAGIDAQQLAVLGGATFQIDDLGGSDLGWERQGIITLDRTADGYGWFIDPTPGDDSEFAPAALAGPARGHIDLLSVVAHEMGHLLGYGEDMSESVTGEYLAPGVRHVPTAAVPALIAATTADTAPFAGRSRTAGPQGAVVDLALEELGALPSLVGPDGLVPTPDGIRGRRPFH
jgi:hypothetical protein